MKVELLHKMSKGKEKKGIIRVSDILDENTEAEWYLPIKDAIDMAKMILAVAKNARD